MKAERGKMAINEKQEGHYSEKQYLELLVHDSWSSSSCVSKTSSNLSLTVVLSLSLSLFNFGSSSPFAFSPLLQTLLKTHKHSNSHHTFTHPLTISPFCPFFPLQHKTISINIHSLNIADNSSTHTYLLLPLIPFIIHYSDPTAAIFSFLQSYGQGSFVCLTHLPNFLSLRKSLSLSLQTKAFIITCFFALSV